MYWSTEFKAAKLMRAAARLRAPQAAPFMEGEEAGSDSRAP